jgi:hypothetical protein
MPEVEIGSVSDFFAHPVVAGIELIDGLKVGTQSTSWGIPPIWSSL